MKAIIIQLKEELQRYQPEKNSIKSLFIGGGTPSTVAPHFYEEFFTIIKPYLKENAEITTEANPNSATQEWLEGMKNLGVTRVSFGVQSFDATKLKALGRNHSPKQAMNAVTNAHKVGIKNISLDLIYATSFDKPGLLENDIKTAFSLPINHISSYALTLEENTPFFGKTELVNDSTEDAQHFISLVTKKFEHYEISNFGEYQSVHNLGYWRGDDYIGIGAGAVGFLKNQRFYPQKGVEEYIQNPNLVEAEDLSEEDLHVEKLFLGLRSKVGVILSEFSEKELKNVTLLIDENKLTCRDGQVYNNDFLLSDELVLFITN
jgi:oxygen-independent coproporphyrinogen-3 oxidase